MDSKCVFVIGSDGYIGNALTQRLLFEGYKVVGIDNFQKIKDVKEMETFSALELIQHTEKVEIFKRLGDFEFYELSIDKAYKYFLQLVDEHQPSTIVNLAQNPSAPFSLKSREHAIEVTNNNIDGTLNMLYAIKAYDPDCHLIQIGSMGEYNPGMGIPIPEGKFDMTYKGKIIENVIFPREPGSFYHASKVASTYYIDCACKWWGLKATDIMQGVVYGNWTTEIEKTGVNSPLYSDEAFGTVVNRFIVQTMIEHPMTVYGPGDHSRGFLSLNDSIQCLMLAIKNPPMGLNTYNTWNQLDTVYTMNEIVTEIGKVADDMNLKWDVMYMDSPRAENTSWFEYNPVVDKLKNLGFRPTREIKSEVRWVMNELLKVKDALYPLSDSIMPKITWN